MTRQITLAALAFITLLTAGHAASAQVVAYRHRSTVWGDHLAGASELVRANGAFLVDQANATETLVRAQAAHDDLMYQRAEYRFQVNQMYNQYLNDKATNRRERNAADEAAERAAALGLWQKAQRGFVAWPEALKRAEFTNSLTMIESILRSWSPTHPTGEAYRRALATEAGVLRAKIERNQDITFLARVDAVRTLDRLQRLADMDTAQATAEQIAMR
jgi:hypothetical protein